MVQPPNRRIGMTDDRDPDSPAAATPPGLEDGRLAALYEAHYHQLLRLAAVVLGGAGGAEDVVQEAFIRVYGARPNIRDADRVLAYLRITTVNLARSTLRRQQVARRHAPESPAEPPGPEDYAMACARAAGVQDALRRLPSRQQQVIVLRYYGDLSVQQTAQTLHISSGSVKTHGSRALAALARDLHDLR
jgi:RNA polymerase sigma-70 factor (sigma-E family)